MNDAEDRLVEAMVPFEARPLQKVSPDVLDQANSMRIGDRKTLEAANLFRNLMDDYLREVDRTLDPVRDQAHKAWKAAVAAKDMVAKPFKTAKQVVDQKIVQYMKEEEARRKAEAEKIRREEERRAEEDRLNAALLAESEGESGFAEEILNEPPPFIPPPIMPSVKEELQGVSVAKRWTYEVEDFWTFVNWAVANDHLEFLKVDPQTTGLFARQVKNSKKIPGLRIYDVDSVRRRSR